MALFAPAWPFEKYKELLPLVTDLPSDYDPIDLADAIFCIDDHFWRPLLPLLARLRAIGSMSSALYRPLNPWKGGTYVIATTFSLGMGVYNDNNRNDLKPWCHFPSQQVNAY